MEKNRTRIKICGLSRIEDIAVANELLPDYIGFVFWERSKRNVTKAEAAELKRNLDKNIKAVGVFVDAEIDYIADLINCGIIDVAQLHGSESEAYIKRLRDRLANDIGTAPVRIIKAFNVNKMTSFEEAESSSADYIMLDSGKGTGVTHDWFRLKCLTRPYFLAGGLGPENVSEAIKVLQPFAVDVSSGVETDGVKDADKMRAFVENVTKKRS
ncbi:phosphoribosylanthranilate isomerase [Lachnospiraceae bacterium NE2001]|nr:phosphoribosylanthranilate isomerase [Lachnospiraceae bacterium NE2001]